MIFDNSSKGTTITPANATCPCLSGEVFSSCCGLDTSTPPRGVIIKKHVLSNKQCDEMVKYLSTQQRFDATIGIYAGTRGNNHTTKSSDRITDFVKSGKLTTKIKKVMETQLFNVIEKELGKTLIWYQKPTVLYYKAGSWYGPHADADRYDPKTACWHREMDRDYSLLIYLSDKFEGGSLVFTRFGYSFRPQKGDMILFPSDHRYIHMAQRVSSGDRYVIVSFCSVKESKKVQYTFPPEVVILDPNGYKTVSKNPLGSAMSTLINKD